MRRASLFAFALLALAAPAAAEPLGVGDRLPPITLEDQHGQSHDVGDDVRVVLFGRDMEAGDVAKEALEGATAATLSQMGLVYVADIHRMPGFVARMFALPSMRKRPYPMLLDREGQVTAPLPSEEGRVVLIRLASREIVGIEAFDDAAALRASLGLPARDPE